MEDADYWAVEQLGVRYAAAIDEREYGKLANCFVSDGIYSGSFGERAGRPAIVAFIEKATSHLSATHHMATNFLVQLDGDTATMRSNFLAVHISAGLHAEEYTMGGYYKDLMSRVDGQWLIARRNVVTVWTKGNREVLRL